MNPQEETTWEGIRRKDGQVFERYYKEQFKTFFLAAYTYVKDTGLAEEIVNDVFMRIWEGAGMIVIETSLKSYIYRAVVNRSLNELEKKRRTGWQPLDAGRGEENGFEERVMEDNELKVRLFRAIDDLPEQCQRVFKMSRFEALKQQEIADRLGISIKTVKNHITYALKRLGKVLADWNSLYLCLFIVKEIFRRGH